MTDMSDRTQVPQRILPITPEDLTKPVVDIGVIPFVVCTVLRVEQWPDDLPPLSSTQAAILVELFDKVLSSATADPSLRDKCFRDLRKVLEAHSILPKSYFPPGVTLSDTGLHASGRFADIWKGQLSGKQVCVKAFRSQTAANLEKIRRRFYREIVGWKCVSHPNVLPFLGVLEVLFSFCIISPWLKNGNIVEYTQKNPRVNRLQLFAQAACGLDYLHSLSIVHSGINPGSILITEDGIACLGDFGITGTITDPTVMEPSSAKTSHPEIVRYMAPELLDPTQFGLPNSNPSKESDVFSFAMAAYETLAEIPPYGNVQGFTIVFHIVNGNRPSRPTNTRWLQDPIWNMIVACWGEKRDQRWDIRAVQNQFLVSSIQEIVEVEQDARIMIRTLNAVVDALPKDLPSVSSHSQEIPVGVNDQPGQRLVNSIDKGEGEISLRDQPELLNILGKICRRFKTIPDSVRIEGSLDGPMSEEYEGGFATVFRGEYRGRPVAIKTVHLYLTSNLEKCFSRFRREVVAWRHLQHPHILPFIGATLEHHRLAMVSEWMNHGNINEFIENSKGVNRAQLLVDAANGLEYMHSINMVHGDLKGANILIDESLRARLADFGLSTIVAVERCVADNASVASLASGPSLMSFTAGGTPRWMSPELLDPDRFGITDYRPTKQSDCYALGMVVYEVLCGNAPYWEITNGSAVMIAIMNGDRPEKPEEAEGLGFTTGLWRIIQRCWLVETSERPDVKDVLFQLNRAAWSWDRRRPVSL